MLLGKHYRMGTLLSKETIANRLNSDDGLSFTEFTYTLLQGHDFERLFLQEVRVLFEFLNSQIMNYLLYLMCLFYFSIRELELCAASRWK